MTGETLEIRPENAAKVSTIGMTCAMFSAMALLYAAALGFIFVIRLVAWLPMMSLFPGF